MPGKQATMVRPTQERTMLGYLPTTRRTCQDVHDELDRGLFAVEERAMRLQKVALA